MDLKFGHVKAVMEVPNKSVFNSHDALLPAVSRALF